MASNVYIEYLRNYKKNEWSTVINGTVIDLRAALTNSIMLFKNAVAIVPTGIKLSVPQGYEMRICPAPGFSTSTGVLLVNASDAILDGVTKEVTVSLLTIINNGVPITPGQKIAQLKLSKVPAVPFLECRNVEKELDVE